MHVANSTITAHRPYRARTSKSGSRWGGLGLGWAALLACSQPAAPGDEPRSAVGSPQSQGEPGTQSNPAQVQPDPSLPTPAVLFAGHVEAAGGSAVISAIKTLYVASDLEIAAQNLHGKAEVWWQAPGQFYTLETIPGLGVTRAGSDGTTYWADDPVSQLRQLEGAEAEQYRWISSVFLPSEWQRFFTSAATTKKRNVDGRTFYDVEMRTALGQQVGISFDADSKLMASQRFKQIGPTGEVPLEVELSDYRPVGGYAIPHRLETRISIATAVQTYTKVEVNAKVDESKFKFPRESEVVDLDPGLQAPAQVGSGRSSRARKGG